MYASFQLCRNDALTGCGLVFMMGSPVWLKREISLSQRTQRQQSQNLERVE